MKKPSLRTISKKRPYIVVLVFLFIAYWGITLWPVRSFVFPLLSGKTLVLLTNEAEARPCGGFVSVYGKASVFPPKASLKNIYALADTDFGKTTFPLSKVSETKKFWDAGTEKDLSVCTETFKQHYQYATDTKVKNVLLVNFQTIEDIVQITGPLSFEGKEVNHENLFATISRSVTDIDRHNEEALAKRKSPLATLGKKLIFKSFLNPFSLPKITRAIAHQNQTGGIYFSEHSPEYKPNPNDFGVTEWNLGGGKSSRYLEKEIKISGRETAPNKWQWRIGFTAHHLGTFDEPLSQDWKGVFEFNFPEWMSQTITEEALIKPGEIYSKGFIFDTETNFDTGKYIFGLFTPRGQETQYSFQLSAFGQQVIHSPNMNTKENTARKNGTLSHHRQEFEFSTTPDSSTPFLTIHTIVPLSVLNESEQELFKDSDLIVELHINEDIQLKENFSITLEDTNYSIKEVTDNPEYKTHILRSDLHTLLIGFTTTEKQLEERYKLSLTGIADLVENPIRDMTWTVIDRVQ